MPAMSRDSVYVEVTIADSETDSAVISAKGFAMGTLYLPAEFDGTGIGFTRAGEPGGTHYDAEKEDGTTIEITGTAASKSPNIPLELFPCAEFVIQCATSQTGATVIGVLLEA